MAKKTVICVVMIDNMVVAEWDGSDELRVSLSGTTPDSILTIGAVDSEEEE